VQPAPAPPQEVGKVERKLAIAPAPQIQPQQEAKPVSGSGLKKQRGRPRKNKQEYSMALKSYRKMKYVENTLTARSKMNFEF
jgi:hypothetical protein